MIDLESQVREALSADADRAPEVSPVWTGPTIRFVTVRPRTRRPVVLAIAVALLVAVTVAVLGVLHVGGGGSQPLSGVPTTVSSEADRARELQQAAERERAQRQREAETERARQLRQAAERAAQQAAEGEAQRNIERLPQPVTIDGTITFGLPADAVLDTRPAGSLPDFVVTSTRWLIPEHSTLTFVVQAIEPAIPTNQLIATETIGGLTWRMYDIGPSDGTTITAITNISSEWMLVTAQDWSADVHGAGRQLIEDLIRTAQRV
jgi:hypothetical protein